jgi:hypothetical protein
MLILQQPSITADSSGFAGCGTVALKITGRPRADVTKLAPPKVSTMSSGHTVVPLVSG